MQRYNATVEGGSGVPVISSHWDIPDKQECLILKRAELQYQHRIFPNQLSLERRLRHYLHNPFIC